MKRQRLVWTLAFALAALVAAPSRLLAQAQTTGLDHGQGRGAGRPADRRCAGHRGVGGYRCRAHRDHRRQRQVPVPTGAGRQLARDRHRDRHAAPGLLLPRRRRRDRADRHHAPARRRRRLRGGHGLRSGDRARDARDPREPGLPRGDRAAADASRATSTSSPTSLLTSRPAARTANNPDRDQRLGRGRSLDGHHRAARRRRDLNPVLRIGYHRLPRGRDRRGAGAGLRHQRALRPLPGRDHQRHHQVGDRTTTKPRCATSSRRRAGTRPRRSTRASPIELNEVYQATLGGYILKDHLWFFGGYRDFPDRGHVVTTRLGAQQLRVVDQRGSLADQAARRAGRESHHRGQLPRVRLRGRELVLPELPGRRPGGDQRHTPRSARLGDALTTRAFSPRACSSSCRRPRRTRRSIIGGDPATPTRSSTPAAAAVVRRSTATTGGTRPTSRSETTRRSPASSATTFPGDRAGSHHLEGGVQLVSSITSRPQPAVGHRLQLPRHQPRLHRRHQRCGETLVQRPHPAPRSASSRTGRRRERADPRRHRVSSCRTPSTGQVAVRRRRALGGIRGRRGSGKQHDVDFDKFVPRLAADLQRDRPLAGDRQLRAVRGSVQRHLRAGPHLFIAPRNAGLLPRTHCRSTSPRRRCRRSPATTLSGRSSPSTSAPASRTTTSPNDVNMPYADEWGLSVRHALPKHSGTIVLSYVDREYQDLMTDFIGGVCEFPGSSSSNTRPRAAPAPTPPTSSVPPAP